MALTKAQKKNAKRAVLHDLVSWVLLPVGTFGDGTIFSADPEHKECLRLLRVAIKAVRSAK